MMYKPRMAWQRMMLFRQEGVFIMEEEDGFQGDALPLLDLPDDLLLRIMTGTGSRSIGSGAAACRRLKGTKARPLQLP